MNKTLLILGGGALLYWWYNQQSAAPVAASAAPANTSTGTPAVNSSTPGAAATNTVPASTAYPNTLASITKALTADGQGTASTMSPDQFNYYAALAIPNFTAPAPEAMFPGVADAHAPVTFQAWWTAVQKFLPAGMSGLGISSHSPYWHMAGGWAA